MEMTKDISKTLIDNANEINALTSKIDTLQREIGSKTELVLTLRQQLTDEKANSKSKEKVVRIEKGNGKPARMGLLLTSEIDVSYKNLDSVIEDIRKEEKNKIKTDVAKLESEVEDRKLQILTLTDKLKRADKVKENELEDLRVKYKKKQTDVSKEHQAEYDSWDEEVEKLRENYNKLKNDKTDKQLEKKRLKEIADLNETIVELEKEIESLQSFNLFKRMWHSFTNRKAVKQAIMEKEEKQDRIERITNTDPRATSSATVVSNYNTSPWPW